MVNKSIGKQPKEQFNKHLQGMTRAFNDIQQLLVNSIWDSFTREMISLEMKVYRNRREN